MTYLGRVQPRQLQPSESEENEVEEQSEDSSFVDVLISLDQASHDDQHTDCLSE